MPINLNPNSKKLFEKNEKEIKNFEKSSLMQLVQSKKMNDPLWRFRLMDCIQVFSDYFQKVVALRSVFCDDPKFISLTYEHWQEEFGHNLSLWKDRENRPAMWDPILEGTASWFAWKMFTLDNLEKTMLVHLILEASANIFFQAAHKAITHHGETRYFETHSIADEEHEAMGRDLLANADKERLTRLFTLQQQGWDMLNTTCDRIAVLTKELSDISVGSQQFALES